MLLLITKALQSIISISISYHDLKFDGIRVFAFLQFLPLCIFRFISPGLFILSKISSPSSFRYMFSRILNFRQLSSLNFIFLFLLGFFDIIKGESHSDCLLLMDLLHISQGIISESQLKNSWHIAYYALILCAGFFLTIFCKRSKATYYN